MAEELQELKIIVKVDPQTKNLTVVDSQLKEFTQKIDKNSKSTKENTSLFSQHKDVLNKVSQALGVNVMEYGSQLAVLTAIAATVKKGVTEWEEQLVINRQLEGVIRGLGLNYDKLKDSIDENLVAMTTNTRYTQDEATKAFSQAIKYAGDTENAYKLLQIAMNVSTGTGRSLTETMDILAQATKGTARSKMALYTAFGKVGIEGNNVNEMINNLGKAYEGSAKSEQSLTKESIKLSETWSETAEIIGSQLNPMLANVVSIFKPVVAVFSYGLGTIVVLFDNVVSEIATVAGALNMLAKRDFKGAWETIKAGTSDMADKWIDFGKKIDTTNKLAFGSAENELRKYKDYNAKTMNDVLGDDKKTAHERERIARDLQNTIRQEEEKTWLGAKENLRLKVEEARKAGVDEVLIAKYTAIQMKAIDQKILDDKLKITSSTLASLSSIFKGAGEQQGQYADVAKGLAIASATIDAYSAGSKALATYPPPWGFIAMAAAIAQGLDNVSKIEGVKLAKGGIVTSETQATIGESGKEAVIPLDSPRSKAMLSNAGMGGTSVVIQAINVTFPNVSSLDDWKKASPRDIKDVFERKILYAMNALAKEGKIDQIVKARSI